MRNKFVSFFVVVCFLKEKKKLNTLKAITRNEGLVQTVNIDPETHKAAITSLTMWLFGKFPLKLNGSHSHNLLRPKHPEASWCCVRVCICFCIFFFFFFAMVVIQLAFLQRWNQSIPSSSCRSVPGVSVVPNHTPNTKQDVLTSCLRGRCYLGVHESLDVNSA